MKKALLLATGLLLTGSATAHIAGTSVPSYTTKSGAVYRRGDDLYLMAGTLEGGSFKYVYIPANIWMGFPLQQLGAKWKQEHPLIKDIRRQQHLPDTTYLTVAVIKTSGMNACVDLEQAELAGEIQRPASSVADELVKLKGLLDAGVLTQAEFEGQKAKLLSR